MFACIVYIISLISMHVIFFYADNLQAVNDEMEMFSVRGDGLTTATTDKTVVSAFVATASAGAYAGTVLEVQTTGTAAGGGFRLLHVSRVLGGGLGGWGGHCCW